MAAKIIWGLFIFIIASCNFPPQMPKGKNIQIKIELDASINNCEQKIYLHHFDNNDRIIDDSVTIKKGQKEVYLHAYSQRERWYSILFTEKGPIDWYAILTPNSYVEASISESDGISPLKPIKGAYATNEHVQTVRSSSRLNQQKRKLHAELATPGFTNEESENVIAEISHINAQLDSIQMEVIQKSLSPFNTLQSLKYFKDKIDKDSLISLYNIAKKRFPDNEDIKRFIHPARINYPPESRKGQVADKLIKGIIEKRLVEFAKFKQADQKGETVDINAISLLSDKNNKISVSQIKGKIILIDFWASWCIPCLEEIPYIQQLQKRYGDNIKICMISIDKRHDNWKKSIESNQLQDFINLTAIDDKGSMDETIQKMNFGSIPYNIILNEQHQIVAKDIHKKELLQKIDSLIKQ